MFKYVWIIILVIAAVIFIGYTIYAIYDSYLSTLIYVTEDSDVFFILAETLDNFMLEHVELAVIWCAIFIGTAVVTFGSSLFAYLQE